MTAAPSRPIPVPERLPPYDAPSEMAVIAGVLLYPEAYARVATILEPQDFFDDRNRAIYVAAAAVAEPTALTVRVELERIGAFASAGGDDYLAELLASDNLQAVFYEPAARVVADMARRRALISAGSELVRAAYTGVGLEGAVAGVLELQGAASATTASLLLDWGTFWQRERVDEDWLLEPLFPRGRSISIYSAPGLGKSLLALDCAARLATGQRVLDQGAGEPLSVLYMDYEMTEDDVYERLSAMGFGPDADLMHFHYALLPALAPLDTAAGGAAVVHLASSVAAAVVFIDTTSRVISGKENDSDTILGLYSHTIRPLKALGCTVIRLDHMGKNAELGQRGTSAKKDDVDLAWLLEAREGGIRLRAEKRRQSWIPEYVDLVKLEDPLRHERADESWLLGTEPLAAHMAALEIPLDWGAKRIRPLLREAGISARNDVIASAIRYRKTRGHPSGTPSPADFGTPLGDTPDFRYGDTLGDTSGHPRDANGGVVPYIIRDTPQRDPDQGQNAYRRACLEPGCIGSMTARAGGQWVCDVDDWHRTTGEDR